MGLSGTSGHRLNTKCARKTRGRSADERGDAHKAELDRDRASCCAAITPGQSPVANNGSASNEWVPRKFHSAAAF